MDDGLRTRIDMTLTAYGLRESNTVIPSHTKIKELTLVEPEQLSVPSNVRVYSYRISYPLIRPSKLTSKKRGGVGKALSNGWALNFAVGCIHRCLFCYVDSIYKRYGEHMYGSIVKEKWGDYFLIPSNIDEAIEKTPWHRWEGKEVLLSSTHDPYLPQLAPITRKILEIALPSGIRFCIQTRSPLVEHDFDLLADYRDNIRLQVSIATMNQQFYRLIETRVSPPTVRLNILRRAKKQGLRTGVILAPIFPPLNVRPDVNGDLETMLGELTKVRPDNVYGECIHVRGENIRLLRQVLGEDIANLSAFDIRMNALFKQKLKEYGLQGMWWPEHRKLK